jgi:hypothetical protein
MGLLLLVTILLNTKPVQGYLLEQATHYLSKKIGSTVTISTVEYSLFAKFQFSDILIQDTQENDLITIDQVDIGFKILPLFKQNLVVKSVSITHPSINVLTDSTGRTNFQHILDAFSKSENDSIESNFVFDIRKIDIIDAEFKLTNTDAFRKTNIFDANHIHVEHFNSALRLHKVKKDSLVFELTSCSFEEKSGLIVQNLQANASFGKDYIHVGDLSIKLPSSIIEFENMSIDYAHQEKISSLFQLLDKSSIVFQTKKVSITGKDIACFAPFLGDLDFPIEIESDVHAAANTIDLKKFIVKYGNQLSVDGSLQLAGINDLEETFIYADIHSISAHITTIEDLVSTITRKPFILPKEVRTLRKIDYSGNIAGFFNNVVAYGKLRTDIGTISTDILVGIDLEKNDFTYSGNLRSSRLQLQKMLGKESGLGNTQFRVDINGSKTHDNKYQGIVKGNIQSIDFNKYTYNNILMDGEYNNHGFNGKIELNDENGQVKFDGDIDFSRKIPLMNFVAQVSGLSPYNLKLTEHNPDLKISFNIASSVEGTTIDNVIGNVFVNDVTLHNTNDTLHIKQLALVSLVEDQKQCMRISSDFLNASMKGKFTLSSIADNFLHIIHTQLPDISLFDRNKTLNGNDFSFEATINPLTNLSKVLQWKINTESPSYIKGFFNDYEDKFSINVQSEDIQLDKNFLHFATIDVNNISQSIDVDATIGLKMPKDSLVIQLTSKTLHQKSETSLAWENNYGKEFNGKLTSIIHIAKDEANDVETNIQILPSEMVVNDSTWQVTTSTLVYKKERLEFKEFAINQQDKFIKIHGVASKFEEDLLSVSINKFNLEYLSDLIKLKGIHLSGIATGYITAQQAFNKPILNADIDALGFGLNSSPFGDVKVKANYNYDKEQIDIEGLITNHKLLQSKVTGYISPTRNDMMLRADMREVNLHFLDPYLSSFAKNIEGEATGVVYIGGDLRAIEVWGKAFVNKAKLHIDYLKTDVYFSDYITLTKNSILLSDITIADKKGNKGKINGKITHNSFSEFVFNIDILLNNMLVYNTTENDNPDFYGTVYASGVANIYGNVDLISIDVAGRTEKNTVFYIPINTSSSALEGDFITFVNRKQLPTTTRNRRQNQQSEATEAKLRISVQIEATPDAEAILILDDRTREYIQGNGSGNIRLSLEPNENMKMYGNYTLNEGKYFFVMQNAIRKTFDIKDGSSIAWDGNPYNGAIDIMATYQVSASLIDLFDASMLQDVKRLTIPVLCKAHLTGELQQPSIKLDLELPTADDELKRRVQNIVNSDEMMSNQMVFLLMLGRFYNPQLLTNTQPNTAGVATMIASATLSSQLNYWLSQISNDVNLGVNYRQSEGGEITSREIEVALTTNLLDNRLIINSNVGYKEDAFTETNFIGDFDIEYKINRSGRLRLKAYSHSNDKYYVRNALTTQGVGVIYREDFDSGKNLWKYYRSIFKKKPKKVSTENAAPIEQPLENFE